LGNNAGLVLANGSDTLTVPAGATRFTMPTNVAYTSSYTVTVIYNFTDAGDGATPYSAVTIGSDMSFYGTTSAGGTHGNGTVFKLTPH
jgi:uncharacterized repeat protein (TIGR03803 family)